MVLWRQFLAFSLGAQLRVRKKFINIPVHRFENNQFARRKSNMADQNGPLTFNSRSKSPNDKFSNFYEANIKMPEGVFGSVEHYFQAMKFIDENHSRFEINGDLGKQKIGSGNWKGSVSRGRFIKSAGGKAGTKKYKLTLRRNGLDRRRAKQKMKEGLRKKFDTEPFRGLLLKTGARELVHTPMRGKTDFWTGRVDKTNGSIKGENNMGNLLMEVRQELKKAKKRSRNQESFVALGNKVDGESGIVDECRGDKVTKDDDKKGGDVIKGDGESEIVDENIGDDDIKDDEKVGVEIEGESEDIIRQTKDSSGYKSEKRKHEGDDEDEPEGPEIKRKKVDEKSKDDFENKSDDNKSDGENEGGDEVTTQETKE